MPLSEYPSKPMHPSLINWLLFSSLVFFWGTSFLFTAIAVDTISPQIVVAVRIFLGAITLYIVLRFQGLSLPRNISAWVAFSVLGVLGNLLPFYLIAWGQQFINSGMAGVIMAIMPLVTIVLAHNFIAGESINRFKLLGFLTGISGVVLLLGPVILGEKQELLGAISVFFAACCYASNTIVARRLPNYGPLVTGTGVLIVSCIVACALLVNAISGNERFEYSYSSIASLVWLGVGPTGIASVVYYLLVQRAGPTFLSNINYLIPAVAYFSGAVFLNEEIKLQSFLALLVILAGIAVSRIRSRRL